MNCLIVDDDAMSRKVMEQCIAKQEDLELIGSLENPVDAIEVLEKGEVDLLFLDVEMPEMTGIDMLKNLSVLPDVVLTTSKKEYAADAFDLDVVDYMVKPVNYARFLKAIEKVKKQKQLELADGVDENNVFIKSDKRIFKVKTEEVQWVEAYGDYAVIQTDNQRFTIYSTMKAIESKLPARNFIRVHRSYIININHIKVIEDTVIVIGEKLIPIGIRYKKKLMDRLNTI